MGTNVQVFATLGGVDRRLTTNDIALMRRSLAIAPQLPADQVRWLLDEAERLIDDRAELERVTRCLVEPWSDLRAALNALHRLLAG